jgi:hypothetical protein
VKVKILFLLLLCLGCKTPYDPDKDPDVLYWEDIDGTLYLYTKQDSINDERERWRYKDSIYHSDPF